MAYPHRLWNWLVDLIFPYHCAVCEKFLDNSHLCERCFNSLPIKKELECIGCRRPTPLGQTCTFCREENAVDQLFIVSNLSDSSVDKIIKLLKYRFLADLAEPLARLAVKYLQHAAKRDQFSMVQGNPLLVAVPLHPRRENWRGFNQAWLIAEILARRYQLNTSSHLIRSQFGTPQAELEDRPERLVNVRGLYAASSDVFRGRSVLLIDDVCTTGATLNECARVLKEAGATHVAALAIARG